MCSLLIVGLEFLYVALAFGREMDESRWLNTNNVIVLTIITNILFWLICVAIDGSGKFFRFKKWKGFTYTFEEKVNVYIAGSVHTNFGLVVLQRKT